MVYFLIAIFLVYIYIFFKFKYKPIEKVSSTNEQISIVIAAKNESQNIPTLIDFLQKQNYNPCNYEVLIVDDNSTDSTFSIATQLTEKLDNYSVLKAHDKVHEGKRGALQIGIEKAKYSNILITDADCKPNPDFLKTYSSKFSKNYDFIFGVAPFIQANSLTNKISCFDNLWVHILTFSFANIKLPYSAAARSFGFKKSSFEKVEGYNNTKETISGDDDLLLREAVKKNLNIGTVINQEAFVFSKSKSTILEFINQKSRHTSTSNYYSLKTKIFLGLWHSLNIFMLLSPLFYLISPIWSVLFFFKLLSDIFIIKLLMKSFGYSFSIFQIIFLQIIYELLIIVNYIKGSFGKPKW